MTHTSESLHSTSDCHVSQIEVGNSSHLNVQGSGSVQLDDGCFNNVLLVLEIFSNLLSIYQIFHSVMGKQLIFLPIMWLFEIYKIHIQLLQMDRLIMVINYIDFMVLRLLLVNLLLHMLIH